MPGSLEKEHLRKLQTTAISHMSQWENVTNYLRDKNLHLSKSAWNVLTVLKQFNLDVDNYLIDISDKIK